MPNIEQDYEFGLYVEETLFPQFFQQSSNLQNLCDDLIYILTPYFSISFVLER